MYKRQAFYYFKFLKPKQNVKGDTDLEDFEFEDYDEDEPEADTGETPEMCIRDRSEGRKRLSDEVQLANDAKQWVEAIQEYANILSLIHI